MSTFLLTGAGFTRNWGGWLADETFEYLLGCGELTPHHRNLLWKHQSLGTGFEGVLQDLRDSYMLSKDDLTAQELQKFDLMLIGMFNTMNIGFGDLEPVRHERMGVQPTFLRDFLCRFDAMFTLNQDTFLERKYGGSDIRDGSQGKWFGFESPGLLEENVAGKPYASPGVFRPGDPPFSVRDRYQPYFKLHGSSNWRALNGYSMLIMGENKGTQIDGVALLDWYRENFRSMLSAPDARLMIIGYSFRDQHINEIIHAATNTGLKIYIIDKLGVGVLDKAPRLNGSRRELREDFQESIIGGSRRPFPASIATDNVERIKIQKFFPIFPSSLP
jgi:SIR2-like protein